MKWRRRIRAALWLGLTWAAAFALGGGVLARVPGFHSDLPFPLVFAPLGFASGVLFSGILVLVARGRNLNRMPLLHAAGWGITSGLVLTGIIASAAALRGDSAWSELQLFGPPLAGASAVCAAGSLALVRRAERRV